MDFKQRKWHDEIFGIRWIGLGKTGDLTLIFQRWGFGNPWQNWRGKSNERDSVGEWLMVLTLALVTSELESQMVHLLDMRPR